MPRPLVAYVIPFVAIAVTGTAVALGLSRTPAAPVAPAASFSVLARAPDQPLPPSAGAVPTDAEARFLGTDDVGRSYFLHVQDGQLCLESVHGAEALTAIQGACGDAATMISQPRVEIIESDDAIYLAVLVPDEYADATVLTSGTRRQVLREHNLRVFELRSGSAVEVTLDSPTYRDLTLEVTSF